jgi:ABC-type branched-subunit amino acid transport system substrate-binding protein/predicted negative regulator of RcsB-dependent stress response
MLADEGVSTSSRCRLPERLSRRPARLGLLKRGAAVLCVAAALAHAASLPPVYAASTGGKSNGAPTRSALEHAKSLIETHQEGAAIVTLKRFLASSPRPEDVDDAYLLMAAALIGKKEHEDAITYLQQLLSEYPASELVGRAKLMLGAAQLALGKSDAALSSLSDAKASVEHAETRRQASRMIAELYTQKGDWLRAIQAWLEEIGLSPDDQRSDGRGHVKDLVFDKMDRRALQQLRDRYPAEFPGDLALIRLIEMQNVQGEEHLADRNIRVFLHRFPNHEYAPIAADMLKTFQARLKSSQHVIAAVLPLSGKLQAYGTEAVNGIQIAMDKGRDLLGLHALGLQVVDSETDKTALKMELSDLLNERRPVAVIGPLLSKNLPVVAPLAEQAVTPFITPSAAVSDLRHFGDYLFSTAPTQPLQTQRLAEHAVIQLGYRRICILYPDTPYGHESAGLFGAEIKKRGGEIIAAESYKDTEADFAQPIRRIKEADLKKYGEATTTKATKNGKSVTRVQYTPGFDAIFLPADFNQVALIAPQLLFYDVKVPLLGTNTWNSPNLTKLADRSIDGSTFVDGFFIDSPDQNVREFVERYRRKYQSDPSPFAAQAYDAARIVLETIRRGATSGRGVYEQLLQSTDFPTLSGPAGFGPNGTLQRRLYVIHVKNGRLMQLN